MVKLYQDLEDYAIETTEKDEASFIEAVANLLSDLIDEDLRKERPEEYKDVTLTYHTLAGYLPLIVEVCCKMRGYKSSVQERRLLIAGEFKPTYKPSVSMIDDRQNITLNIRDKEGKPEHE